MSKHTEDDHTEDDHNERHGEVGECVCCSQGLDRSAEMIEEGIEQQGFVIVPIADGEPAFAYTIGLKETYDHPEFIISGNFNPMQMCNIIGEATELLKENTQAFQVREVTGVIKVKVHGEIQDGVIGSRKVTRENRLNLLCQAAGRYGDDGFEALQLIFPDQHGVLPWQPEFNLAWGDVQSVLYEDEDLDKEN